MRRALCILALFTLSLAGCASSETTSVPVTWTHEWVENLRLIISWNLPYLWGGESEAEGGYDCSGFLYAGAPTILKLTNNLKRSTSARMERGLDGWKNQSVDAWTLEFMDLGFTDGHVFAVVTGESSGLLQIIHSRSGKGPIEEPISASLLAKNPRFKRVVMGR